MIREIKPLILQECKQHMMKENDLVVNVNKNKTEAIKYVQRNTESWKYHLRSRDTLYRKHLRCVSLLDLYTDCMQEEPMYVPKKFRNEKVNVRNEEEKKKQQTLDGHKFRTEMEILEIRKKDFERDLKNLDEKNRDFLVKDVEDEEIREIILSIWEKSIKEDEELAKDNWVVKIEATRKQYEDDKKEKDNKEEEDSRKEKDTSSKQPIKKKDQKNTKAGENENTTASSSRGNPNLRNFDFWSNGNTSNTSTHENVNPNHRNNTHRNSNSKNDRRRSQTPRKKYNLRSSTFLHSLSPNTN